MKGTKVLSYRQKFVKFQTNLQKIFLLCDYTSFGQFKRALVSFI